MTVTVDNYTRILLTVITVLLMVVGVGLWYETPSTVPHAYGRIPDSGEQLNEIIIKVDEINVSLSKMRQLMTSGKIKVQVVNPQLVKSKTKPSASADSTDALKSKPVQNKK